MPSKKPSLANDWPPHNGKAFIRSEPFGTLLVDTALHLAERYKDLDFSDAVAHVFVWFDRKLSSNRRFINARRFPTRAAFGAYVRQALWNAARMSLRQRQRRKEIEELRPDQSLIEAPLPPDAKVELLDLVSTLPEPHKTVFDKYFFDEEEPAMIASMLNLSEEDVTVLYIEAIDMLSRGAEQH